LEEIDGNVKALNKTLKDSANETKELDKALKLDSKSAETVDRKMQSLGKQVGVAAQKVALLKQKQDESNKAFARGDISASVKHRRRKR
jgi:phage-related minor tail protein